MQSGFLVREGVRVCVKKNKSSIETCIKMITKFIIFSDSSEIQDMKSWIIVFKHLVTIFPWNYIRLWQCQLQYPYCIWSFFECNRIKIEWAVYCTGKYLKSTFFSNEVS